MYSPPPMDGFSPPPMSDFSPPPLSDLSPLREFPRPINGFSPNEDDLEDLKDIDYDFSISDTNYDLTGLSDKLNGIELEKINQLPPREIVELKNNSVNSVPFVNNFQVVLELDNKVIEAPTALETLEVTKNDVNQNIPSQDVHQNESSEIIVSDSLDPMGTSSPLPEPPDKDLETSNTNSISIDMKIGDSDSSDCDRSELVMSNEPNSDADPTPEGEPEINMSKDVIAVDENSSDDSTFPDTAPPNDIPAKIVESISATEDKQDDGNWGNFEGNSFPAGENDESWGNFGAESVAVDGESDWGEGGNIEETKVENAGACDDIEFDESDDEFGDFGEADTFNNVSVAPQLSIKETEPSIRHHLETLSEESCDLLQTLFISEQSSHESEEEPSVLLDQIVLKEGEIFEKIGNPSSCSALDHQWKESAAYNIIMSTLGIDSRILLDGESWRSSVPKYPKNAASLMTPGLLTPEPVSNETPNNESTSTDQVSPAQFDWSNSGLTNPLDENDQKQSSLPPETSINASNVNSSTNSASNSVDASKNASSSSNVGAKILKDHMSREAQNILDGLPLLNFMSSKLLRRPTKQS